MSHPSNIVHCTGPGDPHALDGMVPSHDIGRGEAGHPVWTARLDPSDDRE